MLTSNHIKILIIELLTTDLEGFSTATTNYVNDTLRVIDKVTTLHIILPVTITAAGVMITCLAFFIVSCCVYRVRVKRSRTMTANLERPYETILEPIYESIVGDKLSTLTDYPSLDNSSCHANEAYQKTADCAEYFK